MQGMARGGDSQQVSPEELFQVISDATSQQDPRRVETSTKRLKELFQLPGVYDALHEIAAAKTLPLAIRIQASIQFKNEALKNWKSRKPSLIDDLMSVIDTNLQQRYVANMESPQSNLVLQRALQLLSGVTKEFASMKMLNGIKVMKQVYGYDPLVKILFHIFDHLYQTINAYFVKVFENIQLAPEPQAFENTRLYTDLVLSHLLFKTLVTLVTWIWQRVSKISDEEKQILEPWLTQVFHDSVQQLQRLVVQRAVVTQLQPQDPSNLSPQTLMTHQILAKHIRRFGKFYLRMASVEPRRMAVLPGCSDAVMFYWSQIVEAANNLPAIKGTMPPRLYILFDFWFKDLFSSRIWLANGRLIDEMDRRTKMVCYKQIPLFSTTEINDSVLTANFIDDAVKIIITRLLPLTKDDLEGLEQDPEEWVNAEEQENQQWGYELRPCSERVLVQISNQYPEYVTPLLKTIFAEVADKPAAAIGIANKEALYCAVGRCCQKLKGEIPFEDWVNRILTVEVQLPPNDHFVYILQRRIAWVLGKWMSESCCSPNIPTIWQILLHLLSQRGQGSTIIRLTAAVALREGVDTLDFDPDGFAPFLPQAVAQLMSLIGEANTFDSKRKVDDALNVVIDRAGKQFNLDGDGSNLWREAMRNTLTIDNPGPNGTLASLMDILVHHLKTNLELLGTMINIMESYFVLDPARMLQIDAVALLDVFLTLLKGPALQQNKKDALSALSLLIQLSPVQLWGKAMHKSGLFPYLLDIFMMDKEENTQILCEIEYLLSRIALSNPVALLQLIKDATPLVGVERTEELHKVHVPMTEAKVYDLFLDRWWGTFDYMSEPRHRKLVAMGTAALVSTGQPEILGRLHSEIFNLWMDVFGEIREAQNPVTTDEDGQEVPSYLTLYWEKSDAPASYYQGSEGTPEYERRKVIFESDPVRTTQLSTFVGSKLRETEAKTPNFQQQYLIGADPTVLQQIQAELHA
ncbi:hypothetical protein HHX47_DHR5000875 [Lentinula edodes]|nr:hypothetical protein HHX47_DHR5000875 [Lentinula edodes]